MGKIDSIPGIQPGKTGRNVVVSVVYLFLLPLILASLIFIIPILIAKNYNNIATKFDSIPGIRKDGGIVSGAVVFVLLISIVAIIGTAAPISDSASNPSADNSNNVPTNNTVDSPSDDSSSGDNTENNPTDNTPDGPTGDPINIIETWHSALDDGNIDTVNDLIHENASEETGVTPITEGQAEFYNGNSVTLDNTEMVEENDNTVIVEVTATVAGNTETSTWELRSQGGEWKVYGIEDQ